MAEEEIRLPPDVIRTIEKLISRGQTVSVKLDRGVIKIQRAMMILEMAKEA